MITPFITPEDIRQDTAKSPAFRGCKVRMTIDGSLHDMFNPI